MTDKGNEPENRNSDIIKQFACFGAAAFLLETSMETNDEESAWDLHGFADFLGFSFSDSPVFDSKAYSTLSRAIGYRIVSKFDNDEFYYQNLFKKFANIVVPDCELIARKQDKHHQPDAWISVNGDDVPVEVKLGKFDQNAMKQLKRYMSVYSCQYGVAVGKSSDIAPWPDNVFWVTTATLDELEKQTAEYKEYILERDERKKRNLEAIKAFFEKMLSPDVWATFERMAQEDSNKKR